MSFKISHIKPALLASCVLVAACGGGGGGSDPEPTAEVSGKVADGYLNGAKVCLDLNNNKVCDSGEPSAISGAGGAFNLTATQAQINAYPLVVEVVTGTIDEDTNTPITQPYVMSAPVGSNFVSPLTTMVQTKIDANPSLSVTAAESLVKQDLGTALSLFEDYIESAADSTNTDAAEFAQLHNIARVTASVMADNYEAVTTAAAAANTDLDILIQIIVESVIAELTNIVTAVENTGENFDENSVATISGTISNTDLSTLEETIAQIEEEQENPSTEVSSLLALLQSGLNWIDSWDNGYEYGVFSADQNNNINDVIYEFIDGMWEMNTSSGPSDEDLFLTTTGWVNEDSLSTSVTVGADGSLQFNNTYDLDKLTGAVEIDISGQNIATIEPDFPAEAVDANATFSTGAIGYQLTGLDKEVYGIGYWNDGQCTVLSSSGNGSNCVSIHDISGNPATDLVSTIGHQLNLGDNLNYILEGSSNDTSGSVTYLDTSDPNNVTTLTSGSWTKPTINGEELIVFDIPADVQPLTWDVDPTKAFHTVFDGYVRMGWYEAGGVFEALLFNDVAMQDILDNYVGGSSAVDGNTITALTMTPNNSVSISVLSGTGNSYLPELLGMNSIQAEYGDGSTEILECIMHHYNAEAGEHVLHCTAPSDGRDVYLGLSSSNTNVISFFDGTWDPVASGSTQITGALLFDSSNASLSWNINLVVDGDSGNNTDFTSEEVVGATFYDVWQNDEVDSCGIGTWVVESVSYDATNYTLTFCDGSTEMGTYQIVNGEIVWDIPTGGNEYTSRISYDNTAGGWLICITDISNTCGPLDQSLQFDNLTAAQDYANQQNGSSSNLTCNYESGWDDTADGGLGAPITPNSFADFVAVVSDCGTALPVSFNDLAGLTFGDAEGTLTISNNGLGTEQSPGTAQYNSPNETIDIEWYLEAATCTNCNYTYVIFYSDGSIDADLTGVWFRDTSVFTGVAGTPSQAGAVYSRVIYTEQSNFSDLDRATGIDGEIWNTTDTVQ